MSTEERAAKTLELFAFQSTALTAFEVWQFLVRENSEIASRLSPDGELQNEKELPETECTLASVRAALSNAARKDLVVERFGFYTLRDHQSLLEKRWTGYQFGVWREKRIRRFVGGLRFAPFVRGVALAGSQALGLQKAESDIDLFIITEPGWLWLSRTLVTAYFQVLGIRRHGSRVANRMCLNHYVSGPKDMRQGRNWYTALEYTKLRPLCGESAVRQFQKRNEGWLRAFFPNFTAQYMPDSGTPRLQRFLEKCIALCGGQTLERLLGRWQSGRIHKNEPHIIVAEDELSFHPNSKQDSLLEQFGEK